MLRTKGEGIEGKTVAVSGFGNVAWGVVSKINEMGGKVVTLSGPDGFIHDRDGMTRKGLDKKIYPHRSSVPAGTDGDLPAAVDIFFVIPAHLDQMVCDFLAVAFIVGIGKDVFGQKINQFPHDKVVGIFFHGHLL